MANIKALETTGSKTITSLVGFDQFYSDADEAVAMAYEIAPCFSSAWLSSI